MNSHKRLWRASRRALVVVALLLPSAHSDAQIVAGPFTNTDNGHTYYLLAPTNWTAMETGAVALGGHLATIRNTNEIIWLLSAFQPFYGNSNLFIGLSDHAAEGVFVWISGEKNSYRNWSAGEPNNLSGEDYAELKTASGQWNDVAGRGSHFGVVELLARQTNGIPTVRISRTPDGTSVAIDWESVPGQLYQVLWADSPDQQLWSSFGPYIYGAGTTLHVLDGIAQPQRFYRVVPVR